MNPLENFLTWLGMMQEEEGAQPQPGNIKSAISRLRGQQQEPPMPAQRGRPLQQAILPARMQSPALAERQNTPAPMGWQGPQQMDPQVMAMLLERLQNNQQYFQ